MIDEKVLEKLEFKKILEYISQYSYTENGKNIILNRKPFVSREEVVLHGQYVTNAKEILIHNDFPPLSYIPSLYDVIATAQINEAVLNIQQIKEILTLAETSRKLYQFLKMNSQYKTLVENFINKLYVDKVFEHFIRNLFNFFP